MNTFLKQIMVTTPLTFALAACGGGGGGGHSAGLSSTPDNSVNDHDARLVERQIDCPAADGLVGCWVASGCDFGFDYQSTMPPRAIWEKTTIAFRDDNTVDVGAYLYTDALCTQELAFVSSYMTSDMAFASQAEDIYLTHYETHDSIIDEAGLTVIPLRYTFEIEGQTTEVYDSLYLLTEMGQLCFSDPMRHRVDTIGVIGDITEWDDWTIIQQNWGIDWERCFNRHSNASLNQR